MGIGPTELLIILVVLGVLLALAGRVAAARRTAAVRPPPLRPTIALPAELQSHLRTMAAQGKKIQAIKQLRESTGLSLVDAKNAVDTIAAGSSLPTPGGAPGGTPPRPDLAYRARVLAAEGREDEAVRVVAAETGMSGPEATAFVRALRP